MRGKNKCKILKEIRQKIADENDILYVTNECKYQGECSGTCPKCESELRYLERELEKRRSLGKAVTFAGVAVTMAISMSSCLDIESRRVTSGVFPAGNAGNAAVSSDGINTEDNTERETLMGEIPIPGEITESEESTDITEFAGAVPESNELAGAPLLPPETMGEPVGTQDSFESQYTPETNDLPQNYPTTTDEFGNTADPFGETTRTPENTSEVTE